jgi:hypothetical protein
MGTGQNTAHATIVACGQQRVNAARANAAYPSTIDLFLFRSQIRKNAHFIDIYRLSRSSNIDSQIHRQNGRIIAQKRQKAHRSMKCEIIVGLRLQGDRIFKRDKIRKSTMI